MIKTRYGRSCLNSMSALYLLCIQMIFNYSVPAILACTSCERLMRFHCSLTWAWWNIDAKKISYWTQKHRIYLLASYNKWMHTCMEQEMTLKKMFGCISIVKDIYRYMFLHLQTGEMPSCDISSGYALFVKVKKNLRAKIIISSSRRKR